MKITVVHGSPRKGNTYQATKRFMDEMAECGEAVGNDLDFHEIFLPRDFPQFCLGCRICFSKGEEFCPHAEYLIPARDAMLAADGLIFASPVYVLSASGGMKAFLDHFGFLFAVHRPRREMFDKKAMILSTTAGVGLGAVRRTVASSLKSWCVNRIYFLGLRLISHTRLDSLPDRRKQAFDRRIRTAARKFYAEVASGKKRRPTMYARTIFGVAKVILARRDEKESLDKRYWLENGLFERGLKQS